MTTYGARPSDMENNSMEMNVKDNIHINVGAAKK
jgi:hypothetical protein